MSKPDKRDEIIRAAMELLTEQGFHGAPMAQIAERAGVAAGTIYRYFENRDVLIMEIYTELEKKILPYTENGYDSDAPFRVRFVHLTSSLLRYFIDHPLVFRYVEQFHNSPYGTAHRRETILGDGDNGCNNFKVLFEQGLKQQVIKDLPIVILFALTFGPLATSARDHILGFITLDDDMITKIIGACWDAIRR
jgi:AcrR family transcriptional regulator